MQVVRNYCTLESDLHNAQAACTACFRGMLSIRQLHWVGILVLSSNALRRGNAPEVIIEIAKSNAIGGENFKVVQGNLDWTVEKISRYLYAALHKNKLHSIDKTLLELSRSVHILSELTKPDNTDEDIAALLVASSDPSSDPSAPAPTVPSAPAPTVPSAPAQGSESASALPPGPDASLPSESDSVPESEAGATLPSESSSFSPSGSACNNETC